jgi:sugar phosphate isomerase/epimerase
MPEAAPILVSLSSFGAAEVRRHGQLGFARLAAQAGADGVEVRGELLADPERELPAIAAAVPGLQRVYSSPEPLWSDLGGLDREALERGLVATQRLGAKRLKMSNGDGAAATPASWQSLRDRLADSSVELLIENDQTAGGGTLAALERFFAAAEAGGLSLGMTFDLGNWHWTGECPQQAAAALAARVRYVHAKGVQRQPQRWIAVPIAESAAPWRSLLRAMPPGLPWAIEYPLAGDDLLALTAGEIERLRAVARNLA